MRLYVVRHGEAISENVDPRRPLSSTGRAEIQSLAGYVQREQPRVEKILHSTKLRAKETAQILASVLQPVPILEKKSYLGPDDPLDHALEDVKDAKSDLMIIGHLPFVGKLVEALLPPKAEGLRVGFKTGTMVILEKRANNWRFADKIDPHA